MFSPLFEKSVDKSILGRWLKIETASQTYNSIHNKQRLSTSSIGQPASGKGRPPQVIPSPISRHNYMLRPISRIQIHRCIYIHTRTNYHKCPSQTRGRQEEIISLRYGNMSQTSLQILWKLGTPSPGLLHHKEYVALPPMHN